MLDKIKKIRNILDIFIILDVMKIYSLITNNRNFIISISQTCRIDDNYIPCPILLWQYLSVSEKLILRTYMSKHEMYTSIGNIDYISLVVKYMHINGIPRTNTQIDYGESYTTYLHRVDDNDIQSCVLCYEFSH